ncbi:MAG: pimeloyl-ACP methyl ester carboxylesterase [Paraglaciecola sp.]|jgi:pimeloyl-ACP methyl ester carboxylesterase
MKVIKWILSIILLSYLVARGTVLFSEDRPSKTSEFLQLEDASVHIFCKGEKTAKPTVVFETGFGADSNYSWGNIQDSLASDTYSCWYDRLGYGNSSALPIDTSTKDQAAILSSVIEKVAGEYPVVLVAHSYGGVIARRAIQLHKLDVSALILLDSAHENQHEILGENFAPIANSVVYATYADMILGYNRIKNLLVPSDSSIPEYLSNYYSSLRYAQVLSAYKYRVGFYTPLSELNYNFEDVPVYVLSHDDTAYPDTPRWQSLHGPWSSLQDELLSISNIAERQIVPNASHNIPNDAPDYVVNLIRKIL